MGGFKMAKIHSFSEAHARGEHFGSGEVRQLKSITRCLAPAAMITMSTRLFPRKIALKEEKRRRRRR